MAAPDTMKTPALLACAALAAWSSAAAAEPFFKPDDVVAFIGGEDVVRMNEEPTVEAVVVQQPGLERVRFRNLGKEGDTVFEQARDLNVPPLEAQLDRTGATVVVASFGRMEALATGEAEFAAACERLLDRCAAGKRRVVLLEPSQGFAAAQKALAARRGWLWWPRTSLPEGLTAVKTPAVLTQALREKNTLWFHYWRPQNWAFLGGDRTEQPSSRDHVDRSKRWFPAEMEQWLPLIEGKERHVAALAASPRSVAEELASFRVAEGFEVSLFASEADGVANPIQMRFDARGRLWVIQSDIYPQIRPGETPRDKVLVLEDRDSDGRADVTTVYADDLLIPTGLETFADGSGCLVGHGTELIRLRGDGASRSVGRDVLLRGFGTGDNHQNINSFAWGPHGDLWFCQGLHAHARVETPFGVEKLDQAGMWRFDVRTGRLDSYYGGPAEPQNPWGFVFTDFGEPIELAGNNSSIIYAAPGLVRHGRPGTPTQIWPTGRGRKMSNGAIVGSAHFPEAWQGRLIIGGYINNAVWSLSIHDDGAGFVLRDADPLITSTHGSFRPVDAKFGSDGALYVCDWFNPIIGHYQASFRHPDRDRFHGRIWRVTAKGRPLLQRPELVEATSDALAGNLGSADRWTRHFSARLLAERPADAVVPVLRGVLRSGASDLAKKEALGLLQAHGAAGADDVALLAASGEAGARAFAATVARDPGQLAKLAADPHPRVRLQAIVACSYVEKDRAATVEAALSAVDHGTDKFIDYALEQTVHALKPAWLPAFREGRLEFGRSAARLGRFVRADGTADTVEALRGLLQAETTDAASREAFLDTLADVGEADDLRLIVTFPDEAGRARLLPALLRAGRLRGLRPPGDLTAVLRGFLERPALADDSLRLVGAWGLKELQPLVQARARQSAAAMEALVALDPAVAADVFASDASVDVLPAFFTRREAAEALTAALERTPPTADSAAAALGVLRARGLAHARLGALLHAAAGETAEGWTFTQAFADELAAEVRETGNAARGRELFHRADLACVACHSLGGQGGAIGPALDAVGAAQPVDFLIGAVLAPQKEVKESFEARQITTRTGEVIVGYRAVADAAEVVLRDPAVPAKSTRVRRDAIAEDKDLGSLMPAGLVNALSREDLRDLMRFLSELGKPR